MRRLVLLVALGAGFASAAQPATAQELVQFPGPGQSFNQPFYVTGEPGVPSRIYVVEAAGRIRLVSSGVVQGTSFLDINTEVWDRAEGSCECGMFSMAFAPDYATSGRFYVFFTRDVDQGVHELVIKEFRRTTDPNNIDEATGRDVLVIPHPNADNHNGGQLQFGPDGLLYISAGDGGNTPQNGQSTSTLLGKILRIDPVDPPGSPTYSIPASNPFVGVAGADEIYSYGLRNPYRFSFDRLTGDLIIGDVGAGSLEEIDFAPNGGGLGANFGWTCFEGTSVHSTSGSCNPLPANHTPPVLEYPNPAVGSAADGGFVVRDTALPSLLGRYVYADTFDALNNQIRSAQLIPGDAVGDAPTGLTANFVVSFGEDACGHIYVAHGGNTVSRIEPTSGPLPCAPQVVPGTPTAPVTPVQAQGDARGPGLSIDARGGRRAGARGEVTVVVGCDERCVVNGGGGIVMPRTDIGLDPDALSLTAGVPGALHLDLSRREAKRLLGELRDGGRAKAKLELTAVDGAGNQTVAERSIKQKR
jgi:glucose/arabinose dehydrogenase